MTRKMFWTLVSWLGIAVAGVLVHRATVAASRERDEDRIDEALDESFPASDPPAYSTFNGQRPDGG